MPAAVIDSITIKFMFICCSKVHTPIKRFDSGSYAYAPTRNIPKLRTISVQAKTVTVHLSPVEATVQIKLHGIIFKQMAETQITTPIERLRVVSQQIP